MRPQVIPARSEAERELAASRAAEVLREGGLVVHPTETVYGIGGDGSPENNRLVSRVKCREPEKPLILLTPSIEVLHGRFPDLDWPPEADRLAQRFWPGPLTLVVRCPGASAGLLGPNQGLAVRLSPDPTVAAILAHWRRPMTSSSANLTGGEPARTIDDALELFGERPDLIDLDRPIIAVDAGTTKGALPSTIVSFLDRPPRLLREGPVSREELEVSLSEFE